MDFYSLPRRDLQSLCKQNKIPANITNVAMADALNALETVEGLEELLNQTEFTAPASPSSVAKELPSAARRTTRRTITKNANQTSQPVSRSCRLTRKSLAGEMDQENSNMNVLPASCRRAATSVAHESEITTSENETDVKVEANVPKTPAARSTLRKERSKVTETNGKESVQQIYSTRRSVRLLEKCMSDLSLKPKEDEPLEEKAAQEKGPTGFELQGKSDYNSERSEEIEVIPGKDLGSMLEKEWEMRDESLEDKNHNNNNYTHIIETTFAEESEVIEALDSSVQVEAKESSEAKPLSPNLKTNQKDDYDVSGHPVACKEILVHEKTNENGNIEDSYVIDQDSDSDKEDNDNSSVHSDPAVVNSDDESERDKSNESSEFDESDSEEEESESESELEENENTTEEIISGQFSNENEIETQKKKINAFYDEERLKGMSMRQLTKMVKNLAIKNNRNALQTLSENQIGEHN